MRDTRYREPDDAADPTYDDVDFRVEESVPIQKPRLRRRGGADVRDRAAVMRLVRDIPAFVRLLGRLARDPRVSKVDKAIVVATIGYIVMPMDFIPDYIPFLGEVDDVFLLMTALQRLLTSAGQRTVLSHWHGDPNELEPENIGRVLSAAAFFLPHRMRKRLKRKALGRRR